MLKCISKLTALALSLALLLSLCSCSSSKTEEFAQRFAQQSSFSYTIFYELSWFIEGDEQPTITVNKFVDGSGVFDVANDAYILKGYQDSAMTTQGETTNDLADVMVYANGHDGFIYQNGNEYLLDVGSGAWAGVILAVGDLDVSALEKQEGTQEVSGSSCDVYVGSDTIFADLKELLQGMIDDFSMGDCPMDITLQVNRDSRLPASVTYASPESYDALMTITDDNGVSYGINSYSCTITFDDYGTAVAENEDGESVVLAGSNAEDEDTEDAEIYQLSAADGSYAWFIQPPAYLDLESQEDQSITVSCQFSEHDTETIYYELYEGYDYDEVAKYAASIADELAADSAYSNMSQDGVDSMTIGEYTVGYNTLYYTYSMDGIDYECMDAWAWIAAPNGKDCLMVEVCEANGSGDGMLVSPQPELESAIGWICGVQ